jgi:NADPH-dependent 2,4-dienoyl-CoA reductase/sulfur reductase-like enzyme
LLFGGSPIRCLVNPSTGYESTDKVVRTEAPNNVLVIGGGPAGLEAARGAALAGHSVTVHEARAQLGGAFLLGAMPPAKGELATYIQWLGAELGRLGVDVRVNSTVTADVVRDSGADVVVYAAGAKHAMPPIPGIDLPHVVTASDVLAGTVAPQGTRVVVAGGAEIGSETGLYLATQGRQVTVVDQLPALAMGEGMARRYFLMKDLGEYGVVQSPSTSILEITADGVRVSTDGVERVIPADSVVVALGMKPDAGFAEELKSVHDDVRIVGDAAAVGDALAASRAGYELGLSL